MKHIKLKNLLLESKLESEIEDELKKIAAEMKASSDEIRQQVSEITEDQMVISESLLVSGLLSAPKLLQILGNGINAIAKRMSKHKKGTKLGDIIEKLGHWGEKWYIKFYKMIIKRSGIAKAAGIKTDADLEMAAKVMFYGTLATAAIIGGISTYTSFEKLLSGSGEAASTATTAYGSAKAFLSGVKSKEVLDFVKEILPHFKK